MPTCVRCGLTKATSEMRRVRNHADTYACKDATACARRVNKARAEERAANLSTRNRRRLEIAYEQLAAVKDNLPADVWNSNTLAGVRRSWESLAAATREESVR